MDNLANNKIPKGVTFTPVFDHLVSEIGLVKSAIIGVIWRYSQMEDRVCRASQNSIASRLSLSRQSINKHLSELISENYVRDLTPSLRNKPHYYLLSDKVFEKIREKERRINSGSILEKPDIAWIKSNPRLSIFEMFGVNNLYLKKDINKKESKNKEVVEVDEKKTYNNYRNLSNNSFMEILVFDESTDYFDTNPFNLINQEDPFSKVITLFIFGFLWNIFTFELDLTDEIGHSFSRTMYRIRKSGIKYLKNRLGDDPELLNLDEMAQVIDFWFWNSLEGNSRIENIEEMISIYENKNLIVYELDHPEIYQKSREIRVVSKVMGRIPPKNLFPKIYNSFEVFNPLNEEKHLSRIYEEWVKTGHKKNDLSWLFDLYASNN